jgi:hypothetical protein
LIPNDGQQAASNRDAFEQFSVDEARCAAIASARAVWCSGFSLPLSARCVDFERSVDLALDQGSAGTQQDANDLAVYCTPSFVEMEAGLSWVRLGRGDGG